MSDNVRPALYGADYSARIANRASDAEPALVRVAGKHCESGDIVVHADYLPGDVAPGDLLAVPATGAYCWALASNYNYLARPPVVAVRDGVARVIVRGETEEDLLGHGTLESQTDDRIPQPRVALLGGGSVGSQVAALLLEHGDELAERAGAGLELVGIAVRDLDATAQRRHPARAAHDRCRIPHPRRRHRHRAHRRHRAGAHATSCRRSTPAPTSSPRNKALLATHGPELFDAAEQVGAQLYYEAAVGGAIPIIRPLRDSLAGDRVRRILGIVNGTTNYILDRMDQHGDDFAEALAEATAARLRRGRPDRRHRGLRRRAEGRDPREPRLPHHRAARGGLPRGHHGGHRGAGRPGRAHAATSSSCSRSASASIADDGADGRQRARVPGARAARPPARRRARREQRRVRRGGGRRAA